MTDTANKVTPIAQPITTPASDGNGPGRALAPVAAIATGLERMRPQLKLQLPSHIPVERFERIVLTAMNNNPDLLACDRRSLFNACTKAAQDGLLPDGREGALVPFKDKNGKKMAQWMPMAFGLKKLVRQSGEIESIDARIVFQKEIDPVTDADGNIVYDRDGRPVRRFEYIIKQGKEEIRHEPILWGERGEKVLVYAYARWKSGHVEYHPMHKNDVMKRRKMSRAKSGSWFDWEDEMWLKTAIKGIANKLPRSATLDRALSRDDEGSEFEKLKGEAIQSIESAASIMGAPQIEHDPETGEISEDEDEPSGDPRPEPIQRAARLLPSCKTAEDVADLEVSIREELTDSPDIEALMSLCDARVKEIRN